MSIQVIALTAEALHAWSNDPDAARSNLRTIFAGLKAGESMSEWVNEALENCGIPLESDLGFLAQSTQDHEGDIAYWACKLIGRIGVKANAIQESLATVLHSETYCLASRQQAALALASIGTLTAMSREALQSAACSSDARLAKISARALGSGS